MVERWPELQTFHNNLLSSSSPHLISVIPHSSQYFFSLVVGDAEDFLIREKHGVLYLVWDTKRTYSSN